ncbi:multidrug effflux MFS transporter [Niabella beijingensis]|uniref:multidrug effflux MFS transporter n=1 Tax=Niabella beijingensis TaxID=2872700 RepID=UPI001CBFCC34|nr:multidrug effflux MFS transporter [Niabella beijingensis]MBZ4190856.1 multidrug effflux MFS transporter [Niabella beijingensis]
MKEQRFIRLLILGLLSAIGPFSIDMYLPGFPDIAKDLHTDVSKVSLTLSGFFVGISVGQLLYGPLLDKYGRKRPLYIGMALYILASFGCVFATSIEMLIGLRFLQAIGGCVGMVASRAIVRDLFDVTENAKIFSLLMLVVGVSPIIAPTLGGYLAAAFGWQSIFMVLGTIGAVILGMVIFLLPESKKPDPHYSLYPRSILGKFGTVFKEQQFVTYALAGSFTAAGLYAYIAGSPHVFMELFGVSEQVYGWIFTIVAAGLVAATQINARILRVRTSEYIIPRAVSFQTLAGLLLFAGFALNWWGLYSSIILCCIFLACQGFTFPNASALAIAPFRENAGSASALLGCIQMAVGALSTVLVSIFHNETAVPMGGIMAFCAFTALCILLFGRKAIKKRKDSIESQTVDMLKRL